MEKERRREVAGVGVMGRKRMGGDGGKEGKLPDLRSEEGEHPQSGETPPLPPPHKSLKPYEGGEGGREERVGATAKVWRRVSTLFRDVIILIYM